MIKGYSERDICIKLITPALLEAGWQQDQFREEVKLTAGRLLPQCDRIAAKLQDRQTTTEQLLTATIHRILETSEDKSQ